MNSISVSVCEVNDKGIYPKRSYQIAFWAILLLVTGLHYYFFKSISDLKIVFFLPLFVYYVVLLGIKTGFRHRVGTYVKPIGEVQFTENEISVRLSDKTIISDYNNAQVIINDYKGMPSSGVSWGEENFIIVPPNKFRLYIKTISDYRTLKDYLLQKEKTFDGFIFQNDVPKMWQ